MQHRTGIGATDRPCDLAPYLPVRIFGFEHRITQTAGIHRKAASIRPPPGQWPYSHQDFMLAPNWYPSPPKWTSRNSVGSAQPGCTHAMASKIS